LGRQTWRRHLDRAAADAADGAFFADPLSEIVKRIAFSSEVEAGFALRKRVKQKATN
jgi:hypothetical protein